MKTWMEKIKNNWIVDTSKTILLICLLIAIFLFVNFLVQKWPLPSIDVTKEKLYSLSEESKQKVKNISEEVHIYFFGIEENSTLVDLAKQYEKANSNIKPDVIKVTDRPDLAEKYGVSEEDQGIVVQSSNRNKILSLSDFTTYDYSSGTSLDTTEQKLTNALIDTTISRKPKIYFLTGHKETTNLTIFKTFLANEVNDIATLNLLSEPLPEDCDCLAIISPQNDFTTYETEQIISYIEKGGNILFLSSKTTSLLPHIQEVLSIYGVSLQEGMVREESTQNSILDTPSYILPSMSYHKITQHLLTDGALLFFDSNKITLEEDSFLQEKKLEISPIVQSSNSSYYRTDSSNTSSRSTDQEEKGPFLLGAEIDKTINDTTHSKLIVYADSKFATDTIIPSQQLAAISFLSNRDLLLNSMAYLTNHEDAITIRKDTGSITYTATAKQDTAIRITIFTVPIILLLIGIIVWQVRRRKK